MNCKNLNYLTMSCYWFLSSILNISPNNNVKKISVLCSLQTHLVVDPAFRLLDVFPTRWRNSIFYLKIWFLLIKNWLGVATYFCFIFKRVNKIRKKNPKCDSLFGKSDLRKTGSGSGVRLLIGKVRYGP